MVKAEQMTMALGSQGVFRNKYDWTCSQGHTDMRLVERKGEVFQAVKTSVNKHPDVGVHEVYSRDQNTDQLGAGVCVWWGSNNYFSSNRTFIEHLLYASHHSEF